MLTSQYKELMDDFANRMTEVRKSAIVRERENLGDLEKRMEFLENSKKLALEAIETTYDGLTKALTADIARQKTLLNDMGASNE